MPNLMCDLRSDVNSTPNKNTLIPKDPNRKRHRQDYRVWCEPSQNNYGEMYTGTNKMIKS